MRVSPQAVPRVDGCSVAGARDGSSLNLWVGVHGQMSSRTILRRVGEHAAKGHAWGPLEPTRGRTHVAACCVVGGRRGIVPTSVMLEAPREAGGAMGAPPLPAVMRPLPPRVPPSRETAGPPLRRASVSDDTARMLSVLTPAERVRACRTLEGVVDWAQELGLNGPLGGELPDADRWLGTPSETERQMAHSLLREADWDALHAYAPSWVSKMKTALHWLGLFRRACPTIVLFKPLLGPQSENAIHTQEVWAMFGRFMRSHGSLRDGQQGEVSRSDHVVAVIGTLRAYRQLGARYSLMQPRYNVFMRRVQKRWRYEDGPRLERKLMLGLRAPHFLQLDAMGWDRTSTMGVYDHALASTSKAVCARGGEPGTVDGKPWMAARGVTVADAADWISAEVGKNKGLPWMRIWWYPIKDQVGNREKVPIPISKRTHAPSGTDPACPYDALWAWFAVRSRQVPREEWGEQPLFLHPVTGKVPNTTYMSKLAKRMGALFGIDPSALGGKTWRIAGATDIYHSLGEHAERILKERGRWKSDIAYIYARVSEGAHLDASRRMSGVRSSDVEASTGWTQPARR